MHLQADLVGDAHQGRVRERGEVEIGNQSPGVVGAVLRRWIDRVEFGSGGTGSADDIQRGVVVDLGIGLVDDHGPCAVRVPIGRYPRRPVDRPDLRPAVGGHRGRVERGILDVVAHAADVVLAHRLDVEQRAAVVEVELAVPAVVDGVAEVHELRRCADVELQALEDRDDVVALVAQCLLHPLRVDRAAAHPLLDRDLQHLLDARSS